MFVLLTDPNDTGGKIRPGISADPRLPLCVSVCVTGAFLTGVTSASVYSRAGSHELVVSLWLKPPMWECSWDFLCLQWQPLPPSPLLTPVNCSKTQAVAVEVLRNHNKEARRIPQTDSAERTETREHPESASMMDHQQQHAKVERFLKLGYSHSDILRVLESLRHDAQTNDILEELIKTCHTRTSSNKSVPDSPKLVPRGCSPCASQPRPGSDREPAPGFRPVVIDGSNVAMRWVHSVHQ